MRLNRDVATAVARRRFELSFGRLLIVTSHSNRFGAFLIFACFLAVPLCFARDSGAVRVPLTFEQNQGQARKEVRFVAHSGTRAVSLTDDAAVLTTHAGGTATSVQMRLKGAAHVEPHGESATGGVVNYYHSQDPNNWKENVPLFGAVRYPQLYPGIDAVFHGSGQDLEFDFEVEPGSEPERVELDFAGADRVSITVDGGLEVVSGKQTWHLVSPVAYQTIEDQRKLVPVKYQVTLDGTVSFELGEFDRSSKLIIDPVVQYSSAITASNEIIFSAIGTDTAGDLFVTGQTFAPDYPVVNGRNPSPTGTEQVFVTKISPAGNAILYSTYLPSSNFNSATKMVVDANGNAYVTGVTGAQDFPLTSTNLGTCSQSFCNAGFVVKLSPTGGLTYSTLLGTGQVLPYAIAIDSSGSAYVAGGTDTSLQPVNAFQTTPGGLSSPS